MMMIAVLVGGVALLADFFIRWSWFGGFGGGSRDDRDNREAAAMPAQ